MGAGARLLSSPVEPSCVLAPKIINNKKLGNDRKTKYDRALMPAKILSCVSLICAFLTFTTRFAVGQLAPAGDVLIHPDSSRYYFFRSEGIFAHSTRFIYIDYATGEYDSATPVVSESGSFSAVSSLGRSLSGQISEATISITYNGTGVSGTKLSAYGLTRALAGEWAGFFFNPTIGIGFGGTYVTSQGQIIAFASQQFSLDIGVGTVDASGNFSVPLLSGVTISGNAFPSFGNVQGSFSLSNGQMDSAGLIRAVPSRLANISTRGLVGIGEQVLIGGFIVTDGGKTVLMDAKGPSLAAQGVSNPVQATQISLYFGNQLIASNNGWRNNANAGEITASGLAPTDDRESALQVALEPGTYTVIVSSGDGSTGIGLVEVFGVGDTLGP